MSNITVLHADWAKTQTGVMFGEGVVEAILAAQYTSVATLPDCVDKDLAWELTNSVDCSWFEGPAVEDGRVKVLAEGRHRSSSVGDVFIVNGGAVPEFFVVRSFGFEDITEDLVKGIRASINKK